jgi:hypothetical protein
MVLWHSVDGSRNSSMWIVSGIHDRPPTRYDQFQVSRNLAQQFASGRMPPSSWCTSKRLVVSRRHANRSETLHSGSPIPPNTTRGMSSGIPGWQCCRQEPGLHAREGERRARGPSPRALRFVRPSDKACARALRRSNGRTATAAPRRLTRGAPTVSTLRDLAGLDCGATELTRTQRLLRGSVRRRRTDDPDVSPAPCPRRRQATGCQLRGYRSRALLSYCYRPTA